jgi:hypothetical protein
VLGHESIKTAHIYQHADPALSEVAVAIAWQGQRDGGAVS